MNKIIHKVIHFIINKVMLWIDLDTTFEQAENLMV